ncbi:MAG: hypothetical protein M3H12_06505 [Chromatiales bacterium]
MSAEQCKLKLWLQNTQNAIRRCELKRHLNRILHAMRRKARSNTKARLNRLESDVERLHDGAKMFRAVLEMMKKSIAKPTIPDDFNDALEKHEPLDLGKGVPVLIQKPGKPIGPLTRFNKI